MCIYVNESPKRQNCKKILKYCEISFLEFLWFLKYQKLKTFFDFRFENTYIKVLIADWKLWMCLNFTYVLDLAIYLAPPILTFLNSNSRALFSSPARASNAKSTFVSSSPSHKASYRIARAAFAANIREILPKNGISVKNKYS